jgi:hypothetical protein
MDQVLHRTKQFDLECLLRWIECCFSSPRCNATINPDFPVRETPAREPVDISFPFYGRALAAPARFARTYLTSADFYFWSRFKSAFAPSAVSLMAAASARGRLAERTGERAWSSISEYRYPCGRLKISAYRGWRRSRTNQSLKVISGSRPSTLLGWSIVVPAVLRRSCNVVV